MGRKKIWIPIAIAAMSILGLILYSQMRSEEYAPADNEIALHIQLDTKEDIGLLVYDYCADGQEYSGGTSNADRSLIKHDSDVFVVWSQEELDTTSDAVKLSIQFRIITEYVNPNYENVYPESITKYANPLSLEVRFGETCFVTITGDKTNGYMATLSNEVAQ